MMNEPLRAIILFRTIVLTIPLLWAGIALTGCRSTKSIQTAITKKDGAAPGVSDTANRADSLLFMEHLHQGVAARRIEFNTFSAKLKVSFQGRDGKRNDFNANLRMKKDSVLWLSVNALLGFEAFRVLITPDSIKVLNKMDKVLQLRSMSYVQEIARLPFGFSEIQDLIMGNPIYFDGRMISYKKEGGTVSILSVDDLFRHLLTLDPEGFRALHSKLDDLDGVRARTADVTYGEYEKPDGMQFSTYRKITVSEKSKLDIEMKYKQYAFNEALNFPFNIPKNYKLQ